MTIVSSDKDLMQLVGGGVGMMDPIKARPSAPTRCARSSVSGPERVVDVQALAGMRPTTCRAPWNRHQDRRATD